MASPTFVDVESSGILSPPNILGVEPSGALLNDGFVAFILSIGVSTPAHTGPAGWAQEGLQITGANSRASLWSLKRGAGSPALTWGIGAATFGVALICAYRGQNAANILDGSAGQANVSSGNAPTPSIITSVNGDVIVSVVGFAGTALSVNTPAGFTLREPLANDTLTAEADLIQAVAGATGIITWSSVTPADQSLGYTFAIKAVPSGGGSGFYNAEE